MRAVVQRVARASVEVDGSIVGAIGRGLIVLVAAHRDDTESEAAKMADRIAKLRIFNDPQDKMNLAAADLEPAGELLVVSNFTVYGETVKNRRPSFIESAPYERGEALYESLLSSLRQSGLAVRSGVFGAMMRVELVNDGPVTVILDVPPPSRQG